MINNTAQTNRKPEAGDVQSLRLNPNGDVRSRVMWTPARLLRLGDVFLIDTWDDGLEFLRVRAVAQLNEDVEINGGDILISGNNLLRVVC